MKNFIMLKLKKIIYINVMNSIILNVVFNNGFNVI